MLESNEEKNCGGIGCEAICTIRLLIIRYPIAVGVVGVGDARFVCNCKGNNFSDVATCKIDKESKVWHSHFTLW